MPQPMGKDRDMISICLVIGNSKAQKDSLRYDTTSIDSKRFYEHRALDNIIVNDNINYVKKT